MEDRIVGMVMGLAVGDALGAPLEFMSERQVQIKHGRVTEMIGGGWLSLRPGDWTDDTAMMRCLLESLVEKTTFNREDVVARYLAWYHTKPPDIGNTTRAALGMLEKGIPLDEISRTAHEETGGMSAGNGTVMRCAPLAARYADDAARLIAASVGDARITHWDERAASGSALLNLVLSAVLRGEQPREALAWADERIADNDLGLYNPIPDVAFVPEKDLNPSGFVVDTLTCAFWHFARGKSFEETLVDVVNKGGDTDTIGAITGALAGAHHGYGKIPPRWAKVLKDRGLLLALAKRLAKLCAGGGAASSAG